MLRFSAVIDHILFFFLLITFALGCSALVLIGLLYLKHRLKLLAYYLVLMGAVTMLSFIELSDLFNIILGSALDDLSPQAITSSICFYLLYALIAYFMPFFVHALISRAFPWGKRILFIGLALAYPPGLILYYTFHHPFWEKISDLPLFLAIIYSLVFLNANLKEIKLDHVRRVSRVLLILFLIFTPLFIFQSFLFTVIPGLPPWLVDYNLPYFFALFSACWNVLNIYYAAKYFFRPASRDYLHIPPAFIQAFQLTPREAEIIRRIVAGDSNKEIGFTLAISQKTVKNHIYNVFQKTAVQSRVELIKRLKSYSLG